MAARGQGFTSKRVKISSQLQVRIPAELYDRYGFGTEAECVPTETGVEFRPLKTAVEQSTDLLEQLVAEGYTGDDLIEEFRNRAHEEMEGQPADGAAGEEY